MYKEREVRRTIEPNWQFVRGLVAGTVGPILFSLLLLYASITYVLPIELSLILLAVSVGMLFIINISLMFVCMMVGTVTLSDEKIVLEAIFVTHSFMIDDIRGVRLIKRSKTDVLPSMYAFQGRRSVIYFCPLFYEVNAHITIEKFIIHLQKEYQVKIA